MNIFSQLCIPHPTYSPIPKASELVLGSLMNVPALWNFQKADFEPYYAGKKYTTFYVSHTWGARLKNLL